MSVYGLIPLCTYEFAYYLLCICYVCLVSTIRHITEAGMYGYHLCRALSTQLHTAYLLLILSLSSVCCHISFLRESSCLGQFVPLV